MSTIAVHRDVIIPFVEEFNEHALFSASALLGFLASPSSLFPAIEWSYTQYMQLAPDGLSLQARHAARIGFFLTPSGDATLLSALPGFISSLGFSEFHTWAINMSLD